MLNVSNYVSFVRQSFLPTSTSFSLPHSLLLPLSNLLLLLTPSPEKGEVKWKELGRGKGGERLLNLAEPRRRKSRKCVTGTGNRITGAQEHVPECREKRSTTFTSSFSHLVGYSGVKNGRILICFVLSFFSLSLFFSLSPSLSLHLFSKS